MDALACAPGDAMTKRSSYYADMKAAGKLKFDADRARFMAEAIEADDGRWKKHTPNHWSRYVDGSRLDYWPSRKRFRFRDKFRRGDIYAFIAKVTP